MLLSPFQWEATVLPWAHGAPRAPLCSLLLPSHLFSLAHSAATRLLGSLGPTTWAVLVPFPYTAFPNLCKDPVQSEQYHLALQVLDTCSSLAIFCTASAVEIKLTMRLLQLGHLNVSCDGEGGIDCPHKAVTARRVTKMYKDKS